MARITKAEALKIAKKLEAVIKPGGAHDLAQIHHEGKRIAQFGIRRGSNQDAPHEYIAGQINLSKPECDKMARCLVSRDDWIAQMKAKGHIADDPPAAEPPPSQPEPPQKSPRRRRKPR
ncbi:hypothetical protein [Paludisphaera mucosa]|uniref:Uncharacterized protein n=1 Tax=Paludisphaera mucosa TaxID=3030827 RepID=A0ABT6FJQ5_9BACT|nr:hypothetical protein [Paludisphaera mucosa]MDG3007774.1 hypothetical protein [Paludisphaera mucosa]